MTTKKEQKLLYSVKEIFDEKDFLKEKNVEFYNIPHYQRGYKWESKNVEKLLDDIKLFKESEGKFYCVQNITVIKKENYYNVIDGQQRLTTLTILLSYLDHKSMVHNKVRFPENSIRKFTNKILNEIITNETSNFYDQFDNWQSFLEYYPEYDLQDIYHIFEVAVSVKKWFEREISNRESNFKVLFIDKLLNNVKIILNEVEGSQSEEKIFGNLNSKRIPLDGSDLVRAILITRVAREEAKEEADLKNIIFVNERRIKLGWELDQINAWWSKKDVKNYFKRFIKIKSEMIGDNNLFNEILYPINNLYLLYAEIQNKSILDLDLIESQNSNTISLYKDIIHLNNVLQDWFDDKEIYHYLGYIFANQNKNSFNDIWKLWASSLNRSRFIEELKKIIKTDFLENDDLLDYIDLNINWYDNRKDELIHTLLLLDVIESVKKNRVKLPASAFKKSLEDIEHIFPKVPKDKNNKEIVKFTMLLLKTGNITEFEYDVKKLEKQLENDDFKNEFLKFLEEKASEIKINSIGNLVLLHRSLNRSIGNKSYGIKRSRIISYHNEGKYIQPHTFKVFVRDFIGNKDEDYIDSEFWIQKDIKDNSEYIKQQINNFFKIELLCQEKD
ncbi:DUF262 domain-containing protein [Elizabethkingia miricola]|uniref:DUF262 domain-containing protein n=1 Tax=Elizabethkingia miricola TaxID=172045 RepID=A0ABD5B353_ELIMR|nr:DUF262 domain-containing protein [Elizabethkingia miricola]MDQ8747841.1 DUF262 domain-containing protein [Elizabethkingia miricola]